MASRDIFAELEPNYIIIVITRSFLFCNCRYDALESTVTLLPYIVQCLDDMKGDQDFRSDWPQCSTISNNINFKFIYTLYISTQVMAATKSLCTKLQGMLRGLFC